MGAFIEEGRLLERWRSLDHLRYGDLPRTGINDSNVENFGDTRKQTF